MRCATIAIATIICGLAWRLAPLGLPPFLFKYGGSMLWAAMVYWILAALLPRQRPLPIGLVASFFALLVELFRLVHTPQLDIFRDALAGKLLIGKFFSPADIVAYWLAITMVACLDSLWSAPRA